MPAPIFRETTGGDAPVSMETGRSSWLIDQKWINLQLPWKCFSANIQPIVLSIDLTSPGSCSPDAQISKVRHYITVSDYMQTCSRATQWLRLCCHRQLGISTRGNNGWTVLFFTEVCKKWLKSLLQCNCAASMKVFSRFYKSSCSSRGQYSAGVWCTG